ncbi:hypothetical protein S245_070501 [Arachis hypogaea]
MENRDWESEELFDQEMVFLSLLLVTKVVIPISFLLWLMLYQQKACFMFSTVQGQLMQILLYLIKSMPKASRIR